MVAATQFQASLPKLIRKQRGVWCISWDADHAERNRNRHSILGERHRREMPSLDREWNVLDEVRNRTKQSNGNRGWPRLPKNRSTDRSQKGFKKEKRTQCHGTRVLQRRRRRRESWKRRKSTHKHREEKEQVRQVWNRDAARKEGGRGCTSEAVFGDCKADNAPKPCFGPQGEPPEGVTMKKFLSRTTGGDVLSPNPCSQKLADRVSNPQTPRESTFQQQRIAPPPRPPIPSRGPYIPARRLEASK